MKTRRILAALLSASALCAMSAVAFAEDEPKGYVTFFADKATIGQGLVCEPEVVPFYEGETGMDIVKRAADVNAVDSDWGAYVEGFADTDTGAEIPAAIAAVCPEMTGRNTEGYLSSYDYTAESGWSWFLNDEYASVGISGYTPADGDVVWFRFTVYGYGCDLGIDNSSWGGNPALVEAVQTAELAKLMAESDTDSSEYAEAVKVLGTFGAAQADIDSAYEALAAANEQPEDNGTSDDEIGEPLPEDNTDDKASADTGAEGVAVAIGAVLAAGAALVLSKKR